MAKVKNADKLPFDRRGGSINMSRHLLDSAEYLRLSPQAKVLMTLLHAQWRPDRPVGFGLREAKKKIRCSQRKAIDTFKELQEAGFIVMMDESLFCSRTGSKTRTWRLTWMPYGPRPDTKPPTNDWEKKRHA